MFSSGGVEGVVEMVPKCLELVMRMRRCFIIKCRTLSYVEVFFFSKFGARTCGKHRVTCWRMNPFPSGEGFVKDMFELEFGVYVCPVV